MILRACNANAKRTTEIMEAAKEPKDPEVFCVIPKIRKPKIMARTITAAQYYVLSDLSGKWSRLLNEEVVQQPSITTNGK